MKKIMLITLIVTLISTSAVQSSNFSMDATNPFGWLNALHAIDTITPLRNQTQLDAFKIFLQTQDKESINQEGLCDNSCFQTTALMVACQFNQNLPLVLALLEAGANPNTISPLQTPLGIASMNGCSDIITALLRAGADATLGQPLVSACHNSMAGDCMINPEIITKLLNAGALVNDHNENGTTPLLAASIKDGKTATKIVDMLIRAGADVDQGNNNKVTPLETACEARNLGTIKLLLKAGANPNARNDKGETPLFKVWNPKIAQLLINAGADITLKNIDGETAFAQFCRWNSMPGLATVFLEAGADPKQRFNGSTLLHIAARHGNKAAVEEILAFARRNNPLKKE